MKVSMTTRAYYVHISNNTFVSPSSSIQGLSHLNSPIHIITGTQTHQQKNNNRGGEEGVRPSTADKVLYLHDSSCEAAPIFLALTHKYVHWKRHTSNFGEVQMLKKNHCVGLKQCEQTNVIVLAVFAKRAWCFLSLPAAFLLEGKSNHSTGRFPTSRVYHWPSASCLRTIMSTKYSTLGLQRTRWRKYEPKVAVSHQTHKRNNACWIRYEAYSSNHSVMLSFAVNIGHANDRQAASLTGAAACHNVAETVHHSSRQPSAGLYGQMLICPVGPQFTQYSRTQWHLSAGFIQKS